MRTGLGLSAAAPGEGRWWPAGASFAVDFTTGRVQLGGRRLAGLQSVPGLIATGGDNGLYGPAPRLGPDGLITEPERANLLSWSADFTNAAWSKTNVIVTANAAMGPFGLNDAMKLSKVNVAAIHQIFHPFSHPAGDITASFYAKKAEYSRIQFTLFNSTDGHLCQGRFNFDTGLFEINLNGATAKEVGDGWWRIVAPGAATVGYSQLYLYPNETGAFQGDGVSGVFVYEAQVETGSAATSHIATAGAPVTRTADSVTFTDLAALGLAGGVLSAGYTIVAEWMQSTAQINAYLFQADDGSAAERIAVLANGATATTLDARVVSSSVNSWTGGVAGGASAGAHKGAFRFASTESALSIDGRAPVKTAITPLPTLRLGRFTTPFAASGLAQGVRRLAFIPYPAPDAELQALSG